MEAKFSVGEDRYVFRGLDEKTGRLGVDIEHNGFWKEDEKGIFRPDADAPKELEGW